MQLRWTYDVGKVLAYPHVACRDDQGQAMVVVRELEGSTLIRLDPGQGLRWRTQLPVMPAPQASNEHRGLLCARWHPSQHSCLFTHEDNRVYEIDIRDGQIRRNWEMEFPIETLTFSRLQSGEFQMVVGGKEGQVLGVDANQRIRWRFNGVPKPVCHWFFPFDLDGDGADELFFSLDHCTPTDTDGYFYCLSSSGELRWSKKVIEEISEEIDPHDAHVDCLAVGDVDGDGHNELVASSGPALFDHQGRRRWLLPHVVEHGQHVRILPRSAGKELQIVLVNSWSRRPNVTSLNAAGEVLWRFAPPRHLFEITPLDYDGDGRLEIACPEQSFRFGARGAYGVSILNLDGQLIDAIEFEDAGSRNYDSRYASFVQDAWVDNSPPHYQGPAPSGWGGTSWSCALDLDGDQRDELVLTTWDGRILIFGM